MINHLRHEQMFAIYAWGGGGGHCTAFLAFIWLDPSLNLGGRGVHPAHHLAPPPPSNKTLKYPYVWFTMGKPTYILGLGGLPVFRFYFQTGFFGLAFTKTGKPSLHNCLLSSPETLS